MEAKILREGASSRLTLSSQVVRGLSWSYLLEASELRLHLKCGGIYIYLHYSTLYMELMGISRLFYIERAYGWEYLQRKMDR